VTIMVLVAISGTGGTGKTAVAKALVKLLDGYKLIELNKLAKRIKACKRYDAARKTNIVDMRKLKAEVKKLKKEHKSLIIEGLFAHEFDADLVIILRCRPDVLRRRLKRKYTWHTKINENVEAELIGIITEEAIAKHGRRKKKVFEIDTTQKTVKQTVRIAARILKKRPNAYKVGKIDWTLKQRLMSRFLK